MNAPHNPVMLSEVLEILAPARGDRIVDATFGAGGYTRGILEAADCHVLALDRDPTAVSAGREMVEVFGPRLKLEMVPFSQLLGWCENGDTAQDYVGRFDGVVFDLGVSSMQLDQAERGFSFQADGPLDMRMFQAEGASSLEDGPSVADVVNTFSERQLADIIFQLGEEKRSRAVARAIVVRRDEQAFVRTLDLAGVVEQALGGRRGNARHPATKTFQALRMFVNDELGQLLRGLAGAERCLKPGGRLVVVTFHSLEDRIVKRFLAQRSGKTSGISRHLPDGGDSGPQPSFRIVNQRSLTSSKGELSVNPRARSARLRWALRTRAVPSAIDFSNLGVPGVVS